MLCACSIRVQRQHDKYSRRYHKEVDLIEKNNTVNTVNPLRPSHRAELPQIQSNNQHYRGICSITHATLFSGGKPWM